MINKSYPNLSKENKKLTLNELRQVVRKILREEKTNEIFGFSKQEKESKLLEQKIKTAKDELLKHNIADMCCAFSDKNGDELMKHINTRLNMCKMYFPTLVELLPQLFQKQTISSIIDDNGNDVKIPTNLSKYISNNGVLNNNKAIKTLSLELDNLR